MLSFWELVDGRLPTRRKTTWMHPRLAEVVFLRAGRRKTVLMISNSCSAHFLKRRSPLLLHFPTPSDPITPSQVWWSVPTLALKSPRRMFVCPGCCRNHRIQIIIALVFNLIWVGHCWCIGTYNCCMPLAR